MAMSRLVVVSNRIAPPDDKKASAGGLAVGIMGALKAAGGLWFGWSGEIGDDQQPLKKVKQGNITWASFNLSEQDHDEYYNRFSNAVLWPASTIVSIWSIFSVKPGKAISASTQRWRINCCR
jgi:trehalose 6-phosphate synthase